MLQNIFQVLHAVLWTEMLTRTALQNITGGRYRFSHNNKFKEVNQASIKK